MQNAHRSTKKWIAINLDYYQKTIQFEELQNDIKNEIFDMKLKSSGSKSSKSVGRQSSPYGPNIGLKLPKVSIED